MSLPVLPHQLTQHTKLLHKVVLIHEGKVLLLKRSLEDHSRPGCWDLPGGNSEWPETLTENTSDLHQLDIAREIREEIGYETNPANFSEKNLIFFRTFFEPEKQLYSLICGWKLVSVADLTAFSPDKVILSAEHTQFSWVGLNELAQFDFGGASGEFIIQMIKNAFES